MKCINWFLIVMFVVFAGLQYNDPDPYIWMPIYIYAAWLCYQSTKGKFSPLLYLIGFVIYTAYAVGLIFDTDGVLNWIHAHHAESIEQTMKATKPWIEESREFGGLIICDAVLAINFIYLSRNKRKNLLRK